MASYKLIIFDCDGVLVDSEHLSAAVICEMLAELGLQMEVAEALERFNGRKVLTWVKEIEKIINRPIADLFIPEFRQRSAARFRSQLRPVPGIKDVLENLPKPYCVATSGPREKVHLTLSLTGLLHFFDDKIFSGYEIGSWKPAPDLFLHAANAFLTAPEDCIVIEDSQVGIQAGLAAGMTVLHYNPHAETGSASYGEVVSFNSMDKLFSLLNI